MVASIARVQDTAVVTETVKVFRGLAIRMRPALDTLGLEPPPVPSTIQGDIAFWYTNIVGKIGSLPERLRQVLRTKGECIVNLVGNIILTWVHHAARRSAGETSNAAVAEVVA
jgi:hypothetical protein